MFQRNDCAADVSFIENERASQRLQIQALHRDGQKMRFADSESHFLATKIFLGNFAFHAPDARAGELFARFAKTDSQNDSVLQDAFESGATIARGHRDIEKGKPR